MRTRVAAVVAILATVTAPLAPVAYADDGDNVANYLDELRLNGFKNNDAEKDLRLGRAVCRQMDSGIEPLTIAIKIMDGSQIELKPAYDFVGIAARNLCPWHNPH